MFPLLQIVGAVISDSRFLGPIELGLNAQFNAFIGGRGTGKSSLLEYIRWALCDDPLEVAETAELPNFQKRRKALVDDTLRPVNATVTVFYKKNEVVYRIERSASAKDDECEMTWRACRSGSRLSRYEGNFLSFHMLRSNSVALELSRDEINRLITDPVKEDLGHIQENIELPLNSGSNEHERYVSKHSMLSWGRLIHQQEGRGNKFVHSKSSCRRFHPNSRSLFRLMNHSANATNG